MQTIGLNICQNKKLDNYISNFTKKIFNIENVSFIEINRTLVDSSIINIDYLDNVSYVKIYIETKIQILFLLDNQSNYCYEKLIPSVEYIPISKFIDGHKIDNFFIKNKVTPQIFIDNIYCKIIDNHTVAISFYFIINLQIKSAFFIAYNIENNLFVTLSNGTSLKQKTYTNSTKYTNIIFQGSNNRLLFLKHTNNQSLICYEDAKSENKNHFVDSLKNVNNFYILNKNTLIVSNNHLLYTYDLNTKKTNKLNIPMDYSNFDFPYYDKNNNLIYFICQINNKKHLCSFSKNNNLDILYEEVVNYKINNLGDMILLKDTSENLIMLNCVSRISNALTLDFAYNKIIKFDFFIKFDCIFILILYSLDNYNYLISYNLSSANINYLCADFYINDFDIDNDNMNLYVCYKNNNISTVVKIHDDIEDIILQIPKDIKNISIKKSYI